MVEKELEKEVEIDEGRSRHRVVSRGEGIAVFSRSRDVDPWNLSQRVELVAMSHDSHAPVRAWDPI